MLNIAGAIVSSQRYWPFGAARDAHVSPPLPLVTETDKLYTGQQIEGDSALGLYNYKARFYSTALGRFVSVDPLVPAAGDPQAWNPYTYVRNNPLRLVDPTGKKFDTDIEAAQEEYKRERDPYYQQAAAESWVSGQAMQPAVPCELCLAWIAAAKAYADAAAAQAWSATVAQPTAASAAVVQAAPEASGGGGCGWLCKGMNVATSVGSSIGEGVSKCAHSSSCTAVVGATVAIGGTALSPLCGPAAGGCAAGAIIVGTGISTANDVRSCRGGDGLACGMIPADIGTGAVGAGSALGMTAKVSWPLAVAGTRVSGGFPATAVDFYPSPMAIALQMTSKLGFDAAASKPWQWGYAGASTGYSVVRDATR